MCISYNFLSFFYLLFLSLSRLNCRQHPCFMDNFIVFLISRARIFRMHWVCVCMYLEPFSSGLSLEYKGSINGKSNFQIQDVMSILRGRPISSFLMSFALFFGFFFMCGSTTFVHLKFAIILLSWLHCLQLLLTAAAAASVMSSSSHKRGRVRRRRVNEWMNEKNWWKITIIFWKENRWW